MSFIFTELLVQGYHVTFQRGVAVPEEGWEYDAEALEFQHLRRKAPAGQIKERKKVRRSSTLRSFQVSSLRL